VYSRKLSCLSKLDEEGPWTIHGIAIGEGDVTRGQSGIRKKWPKDALKPAAETLEGRSLVEDHDNTSRGVVGTVLNAEYKDGVGVLYEAELHDRDLAKRVKSGLLEVSIRGYHEDVDQMSETDDGAKLVTRVRFDNLSIVPSGAAPSNTAEFGPSSELSAAECAQMMGVEVSEAATKTQDVPTVESNAPIIKEGMKFFSTVNDSEVVIVDVDQQVATVETVDGESSWEETIEDIIDKLADGDWEHSGHMEEMADEPKFSQGDWVRWDTRNSTEIGKVTGSYTEGDDIPDIRGDRGLSPNEGEHLYTLRMYKERDGAFHPIEGKPIGHYEDSLRAAEEPSNVSESSVELGRSNAEDYTDFSEDDWVQWYTEEGERHGKVTSVNSEDGKVTAQVWDQTSEGEWYETDEDVTKAFDDKIEPWGNFPREQDDFADAIDGEDPRRAVKPSEEENADPEELVSDEVEKGLKNKVEEHNEEHGDDESKRVTYRMLKNVFNRGMGAYQDSHREGMTAQQWSYARVNAFLYLLRNGNPENDAYVQDNDLLPESHPKYDPDAPDGDEDEEENAQFIAEARKYEQGDYVLAGLNDNLNNNNENATHARIEKVVADGIIKPEEISNSQPVSGTEMNPAALLRIYEYDSGTWKPTQSLMAEPFSALQKWDVSEQAESDMAPEWKEGQLVRWQAKPDFFGQIVHVDEKTHKVMVEVHERNDGQLESTGFTVTAGYSDLLEMNTDGTSEKDMEEMSAEELQDELDEVYSEWNDKVNMSASELQDWSEHPCSREASQDPTKVIRRNLRLLERSKDEWTENDVEDAKRTISFIERMRGTDTADKDGGVHGCPSKRDISLMNWAYNPFDSMPDVPEDLDSVERVELGSYDVPEGAEFDGNPSKYDEEPERYPEGEDTPREDREGMHEYEEEERASERRMIPVATRIEQLRIAELADYEMHEPNWDDEEPEADWNSPDLEDFESEYEFLDGSFDDLSESEKGQIADHFLIAEGGFPGETYGDLKLPVVEPDGRLSLSALRAVKGGRGVTAVDGLSSDMEDKITGWVDETAKEVFDKDWGDSESMAEITKDHDDVYMDSDAAMERADEIGCDTVHEHEMDGDTVYMPCETHSEYRDMVSSNSYHGDKDEEEMSGCVNCGSANDADSSADASGKAGKNTVDVLSADRSVSVVSANGTGNEPSESVTINNGDSTMTDEITEEELSELRQKANAYDELEGDDGTESAVEELREEFQSDLEELKERTALLDEVNRSDVEALQETDEPHIMERDDFEELEEEVETVRSAYAEQLSAHTGVPQERIEDKWTLEEMREDLEDELDDDAELEGQITPDPQGADPDEETAEENAEGDFGGSTEELSEEAEAKQEEIRSRIMG
jgi:hypothetical protein